MTHQPLTLLQRGVIQRLREVGCPQLASEARDAWSRGERAPISIRRVDSGSDEAVPEHLRAEFDQANAQADQPS